MPLSQQEEQIVRNAAWLDHLHKRFDLSKKRVSHDWLAASLRQRRALCFDAGLRPSSYAELALEQMTSAEREAIRQSVIALALQGLFPHGVDAVSWEAGFQVAVAPADREQSKRELLAAARIRQQARTLQHLSQKTAQHSGQNTGPSSGPRPIGQ